VVVDIEGDVNEDFDGRDCEDGARDDAFDFL